MAQPTYFTCTLGQASALQLTDRSFTNINAFLDKQAADIPLNHAAGFAIPPKASEHDKHWRHEIYTFQDLRNGSIDLARRHIQKSPERFQGPKTVALLCPSTADFLFTWLALMRLGLSVLLIAPQCQPAAIAHLCKVCSCSTIIYDEQYAHLAAAVEAFAANDGDELKVIELLARDRAPLTNGSTNDMDHEFASITTLPNDVAYLHHTSGTSSGVPKPINVTHQGGCGVLPCFLDGKDLASFTTTPLYHGGVADAFRAWTSGALIWLFPGKGIPIAAKNIIKCLEVAQRSSDRGETPPVKYFSSVPYVLQSMEADEYGLELLTGMDIVGVGGAALPTEVGDRLVKAGVNLISRFGSAECGFLMSSHRDYSSDKDWQYLRSNPSSKQLTFEPQGNDLVELVVKDGWPNMAKRNRDDGSLATADLFVPHPTIQDAWKYHSRADSQLTLVTGKKFDPAPLEDAIATSDLLDDVLIFGSGQAYAGALLFRSDKAKDVPDADLIARIWPAIESLNKDSQDHARLARRMLVSMPRLDQPLEKSSKGTVIRGAAEQRFAPAISSAYTESDDTFDSAMPDERVLETLRDQIQSIVGQKEKPEVDTDLYAYGVDSVAGMRIRSGLRRLLPATMKIPLNIVEDCGTVEGLATFVVEARHGRNIHRKADDEELKLMLHLVAKYSKWEEPTQAEDGAGTADAGKHAEEHPSGDVVVLTGVTGALGAHLLDLYTKQATVRKVYCLVRGADDHACEQRVIKALEYRGLDPLDLHKVVVLRANLGHRRLGLSSRVYERIAREATIILHAAWSVNFRMRLRSFEHDNIAGVANLINLAMQPHRVQAPRFGFCSSVASVLGGGARHSAIPETISHDPGTATTLGYSRSKWVAEALCDDANKTTRLGGRIDVFRVGQLAGDSHRGVWNTSEAWPLMLSTVKVTGTLPDLSNEALDWLPVDVAAVALVQGMASDEARSSEAHGTTRVMHVMHPGPNPTWHEMLLWLQPQGGFGIVSPRTWVASLESAAERKNAAYAEHPAFKLLDLWKTAYASGPQLSEGDNSDSCGSRRPTGNNGVGEADTNAGVAKATTFEMDGTKRAMPVLGTAKAVDRAYVGKLWRWINDNM